ncbi:PREDICTED: LIM and SH3 domain protein Lasp isoform X4 [Papilio xuthus]|uniref:LIM and SH3 domain protein Lasp isoform X4 n=1 Tax=Papilio xuthus TaxID=66420 RepID=A0AAJ7EH64_PAPXU|nr:PREDICTED: LIM and SH3 domain protein Lasp isoform X4 [Papilio xuthus]
MNKTCARCEKTVYPTEELKCLDKVWHKGCFKCQECGMTLNMRTYKGYGKLPYCEAHVPKAKHTTMAETPELKRIAENTKIQSNVKYHADFEKSKGKFTQVADDPETLRIKANTKIISNVAYHGDLAKKAAMEKQRQINENGELVGGQQATQQQSRQIGRVTDLDPLAAEQPRSNNNHQPTNQRVYIAMYDYEANDSDEVSFREGDYISNVTSIDEGWMTGEVLRTGRTGMLPANYVELAPAPPHHYAN